MIVGLCPLHTVFSVGALWFVAKLQGGGISVQGCRGMHTSKFKTYKFKVRGNIA